MNPLDDPLVRQLSELQQTHWPQGVPHQPRYPLGEITLTGYLRQWARRQPDKPAVIYYGARISYGELDRLSDRFAALLARHGIRPGDRVAVMLGNCPQFHVAFYGILKLGAVHVPVNPMFKEHEMSYELQDSQAKALLVLDELAAMAVKVLPGSNVTATFVTSLGAMLPAEPTLPLPPGIRATHPAPANMINLLPALDDASLQAPEPASDLDATAALNYTGGTTGMPKGCVHTQRDMIYTAATACTVANNMDADDVSLNYMSLFWIAGENVGLIFPIFLGSTVVQLARWDPLAAMAAIDRYRCTRCSMVLDNAVEILEHPARGQYNFNSLKAVRVSSFVKKLNPDYRARWRALTGTVLAEAAWGMTETHTSDTFTTGQQENDLDLSGQPVFVGFPVPGTYIRICDFNSGQTLPLGREGEIVVHTPSQLKAYWNKPEASAASLREGWFHTGDIGVYDARGCLHFLGRSKEMLKVKGMSVFPTEIEVMLGQHPDVVGSGVIGRADPDKGEAPVAFVRVRAGSSLRAEDLRAWCKDNMASYKIPEIHIVESLPMTATGKVKKHELQALLGSVD